MRESGCYSICLAIESGDPDVLKKMNKVVPLDKARQVSEWCRELEIFTLGLALTEIDWVSAAVQPLESVSEYAMGKLPTPLNPGSKIPFETFTLVPSCNNE